MYVYMENLSVLIMNRQRMRSSMATEL